MPTLASPDSEQRVYDSDEETARLERGMREPAAGNTLASNDPREETNNLQSAFDAPAFGEDPATKGEQAAVDSVGKGYTGGVKGQIAKKAKVRLIGTLVGILVTGGVGGMAVLPSLEMFTTIHYSQTLQKILKPHTSQRNSSISKIYKYLGSKGEIGRTRLSFLQNMNHDKIMADINSRGYTLTTDARYGRLRAVALDPSKIAELQGKSDAEVKKALAEKYKIDESKITGTGDSKFRFSLKEAPLSVQQAVISDMVKAGNGGRRATYVELRRFRLFYNVPTIFQPFKQLDAATQQKIGNVLADIEAKRSAALREKFKGAKTKVTAFKKFFDERLTGFAAAAGFALMAQGALCGYADAAATANDANQAYIDTSVQSGMDAIAMGEQIEAGQGVSSISLDAANANLTDSSGYSALDSNVIRSLNGQSAVSDNTAYTKSYQESYGLVYNLFFARETAAIVADKIHAATKDNICSTPGQVGGFIIGIGLFAAAAASAFETGGGGAVAVLALKEGIKGAIISLSVQEAFSQITKSLTHEVPDIIAHQGRLGGDIDGLGVMAGANIIAASHGGSELSQAAAADLMKQVAQDDAALARNRSIASRLFDPKDSTSLFAKVIDSISTSPTRNLAKVKDSFTTVASSIFNTPYAFVTANAAAASSPLPTLDMSFYGDQPEVAAIEDPIANGDQVADLVHGINGSALIAKAKTCYGVQLGDTTDSTTGATYFDAQVVSQVKTISADYQNANCSDMHDPNWVKVTGFVGSVSDMESISCGVANYRDSCTRLGYNGGPATDTSTANTIISQPATATATTPPNDKGWAWPISGVGRSNISRGYYVDTQKGPHKGIDLPKPAGTPILAAHNGTVSKVTNGGACGLFVIVDTGTGLWAAYQHLSKTASVKVGDKVVAGQTVVGTMGTVGDTGSDVLHTNYTGGCSSGAHLHFSIEKANRVSSYADSGSSDTSVNPLGYLP